MTGAGPQLRRVMRFRDVVLFYIVAVTGPRWIASAAAAGPSSLVIWAVAAAAFFVPSAFAVLELSSRYPDEGGIYLWVKEAFGERTAFMAGWLYWASNLVYFPGLLYFAAGNALFIGGHHWIGLSGSATYYVVFSLAGLGLALWLNVVGLDVARHLHNVGAWATWVPVALLALMGLVAWTQFGVASDFSPHALVPSTHLSDIAFWATLAFAFGGLETASLMGGEIEEPARTIPRAVVAAGLAIAAIYVVGTVAILVALPAGEVSGIQGIMQAIQQTADRVGFGALVPITALLLAVGSLGGVGAWLAASSRLPYVAGIDRALPSVFGRLHPKWGTPAVALTVQAAIAAVFTVLGQAGTNVRAAYDVLVSMCVVCFFIPYVLMFAAYVQVQAFPAGPAVRRPPGGRPVALLCGIAGVVVTLISIALACLPGPNEAVPALAVIKIVGLNLILVVAGFVLYGVARRNRGER
ncbi:MAG TPA: APC family permease [Gemmatimonadales bacterium]|nr:APC family permease [Gemmatimonadales bacterium]